VRGGRAGEGWGDREQMQGGSCQALGPTRGTGGTWGRGAGVLEGCVCVRARAHVRQTSHWFYGQTPGKCECA